jgi:hypothetical protein
LLLIPVVRFRKQITYRRSSELATSSQYYLHARVIIKQDLPTTPARRQNTAVPVSDSDYGGETLFAVRDSVGYSYNFATRTPSKVKQIKPGDNFTVGRYYSGCYRMVLFVTILIDSLRSRLNHSFHQRFVNHISIVQQLLSSR